MRSYLAIIIIFLSFSCKPTSQKENENNLPATELINSYAEGFTVTNFETFKVIQLSDVWRGEKTPYQYVLYKDKEPEGYENAVKIKVPIRSIACMSLTHIAFIEALEREDAIVAASGCQYSNSQKIIKRVNEGRIVEIGSENALNYEVLAESKPDLVMMFGINESSLKYVNKLKTMGMTTVLNAEYMEAHPLGKAEWIKFVAAFFDEDEKADLIFKDIEQEYHELSSLTKNLTQKPTVFVGMPWNGNWYVAGGKSFQAQLFYDAGADYIWSDNNERSSIIKNIEIMYDKAYDADFWLNQNSYSSIQSILEYDKKLANFKAVKTKQLYNNNKRMNTFEGNDYWESGTVNPQVILKDMIAIFHPELLEDYDLYYYQQLH